MFIVNLNDLFFNSVQGESNIKLSDGIYQAYNMAECLRLYLVSLFYFDFALILFISS